MSRNNSFSATSLTDNARRRRRSKSNSAGSNTHDILDHSVVSSLSTSLGTDSCFTSRANTPRAHSQREHINESPSTANHRSSKIRSPPLQVNQVSSVLAESSVGPSCNHSDHLAAAEAQIITSTPTIPRIEWSQRRGFICLKVLVKRATDITVTEVGPIRDRKVKNGRSRAKATSPTPAKKELASPSVSTSLITIRCRSSPSTLSTTSEVLSPSGAVGAGDDGATNFIISFRPYGHLRDAAMTAVKAAVSGQYFRLFFNKEKRRTWPRLTYETAGELQAALVDQHANSRFEGGGEPKIHLPHSIHATMGTADSSPIRPLSRQWVAKVDIPYDWSYDDGYLKSQFPEGSDGDEESADSDLLYGGEEATRMQLLTLQEEKLTGLQKELDLLASGKKPLTRQVSTAASAAPELAAKPSDHDKSTLDKLLDDDRFYSRKGILSRAATNTTHTTNSDDRKDGEADQPSPLNTSAHSGSTNASRRATTAIRAKPLANPITKDVENSSFDRLLLEKGLQYSDSSDDGDNRSSRSKKKRKVLSRTVKGPPAVLNAATKKEEIRHSRTNSAERLFAPEEGSSPSATCKVTPTPVAAGIRAEDHRDPLQAALAAAKSVENRLALVPPVPRATTPPVANQDSSDSDSSTDVSSLNSEELEEDFSAGVAEQLADEQGMKLTDDFYQTEILLRIATKKKRKAEQTYRRMLRAHDSKSTGKGSEQYRRAKKEESEDRHIYKVLRAYAKLLDQEEMSSDEDTIRNREKASATDDEGRPRTLNEKKKAPKKSQLFLQAIERQNQLRAEEKEQFSKRVREDRRAMKDQLTEPEIAIDQPPFQKASGSTPSPTIHPVRQLFRGDWWNSNTRHSIRKSWVVRTLSQLIRPLVKKEGHQAAFHVSAFLVLVIAVVVPGIVFLGLLPVNF